MHSTSRWKTDDERLCKQQFHVLPRPPIVWSSSFLALFWHLPWNPAAPAAKSLQSCLTVRPHRQQPTRLPCPWDSPGKNTGVGFHFLLQCMKVKIEDEVTQLCLTFVTSWTAAYQAPLSMGFSRQEYWSGVPLPSPENFGAKHKMLAVQFSSVQSLSRV